MVFGEKKDTKEFFTMIHEEEVMLEDYEIDGCTIICLTWYDKGYCGDGG